eukprot:sb/3476827/
MQGCELFFSTEEYLWTEKGYTWFLKTIIVLPQTKPWDIFCNCAKFFFRTLSVLYIIDRLYKYLESVFERELYYIYHPYVHHFYHNVCFKGLFSLCISMREKCMICLGVEFFVL